jgi:tetratricopeptide (TPR) repeat protein
MKTVVAILAVVVAATSVAAQERHEHHDSEYGQVHFPVSCAPKVHGAFNRAVAVLHSFGYDEARRAFLAVAEQDPACGMAQWGVAMTYYHPLWAPPTPDELAAGRAAAERAAVLGAATNRERAYVAAINAFYGAADKLDHRTRAIAYRDAMERLVDDFPDDDEASIFHALAILAAAPPSDPAHNSQKKAAGILNALLPRYPRHPGIAHYTIHAFDQPKLAELALPAARLYADLAPDSPHALHMPTHIFTRLGLWDESLAANIDCEQAAKAQVVRTHPGAASFEALHCADYLAYAYLQLGNDAMARTVLGYIVAARRFDDPNFAVGYALLAVPARFALERRDWKTAAELTIPDIDLAWTRFRYAQAITYFANAIGAARSGQIERAHAAVGKLERLHAELAAAPPAGPYDWAGQVEATWLAAAGWLAFAGGHNEDAVRLSTRAAQKEEAVGKHPVTPGAVLPARELLGDLFLELERPREALAAYEAALADAPRRFNGLAGAARAARAAGETESAAKYYRELVKLAGSSKTRVELAQARAFLESRRR